MLNIIMLEIKISEKRKLVDMFGHGIICYIIIRRRKKAF